MSFGNLIQAWSHLQYEGVRNTLNKKTFGPNNSEAERIANQLRETGLYVLNDYYSPEECDKIIADIDKNIEGDEAHTWQDEAKSDTRLYGSHLYSEAIARFHKDPFLHEIGERYLQSELINSHTLGARLIPKDNNLGSGGGWHRDSVFRQQYKSIIYLTDVGPDNGPFEFVLGSHKPSTIYSSIKKNGFSANQNRISNDQVQSFLAAHPPLKSQIFTAKRGTVILVDTSGIHRGRPITEGTRYALTNYFYPKHHYSKSQKQRFEKLF